MTGQTVAETTAHPPRSRRLDHLFRTVELRPLPVAFGMIAVQLCYRVWCIRQSGWWLDDFRLMDRVQWPGATSLPGLLQGYDSHMIPGVLLLTSLITKAAPFDFTPAACLVVLMQALASLGLLRFLVVAFGPRLGILAPLALYLVSPFAIQSAVWWTPGSHNTMLQVALAWGLAAQVSYLRNPRWLTCLLAAGSVFIGLLFLEKAALVIGALAFITVAYFTQGSARDRLLQVWRSYRPSVLVNSALGLGFLVVYVHFALAFTPSGAASTPIGPMVDSLVLRSWLTGLFGGPLSWSDPHRDPIMAEPSSWLVLACLAAFVLVVREVARSRRRSLRSLWLPGYFLGCNVLLLVAAHQGGYGGTIGFEFRYIGELSMASAMCLALATMPILGAVEPVEITRPSPLLDNRRSVALSCSVVAVLALVSTTRYVESWKVLQQPTRQWVSHLVADTERLPPGAAMMDTTAPSYVALATSYPANLISHLIRPLRADIKFPAVGNESLRTTGSDGHIGLADVTPVRTAVPVPDSSCGYRADHHQGADVRLNGPVAYGTWWVRIGYLASAESRALVSAGGTTYPVKINRGLHALFFLSGSRPFDNVQISSLTSRGVLCTADVRVGQPTPQPEPMS